MPSVGELIHSIKKEAVLASLAMTYRNVSLDGCARAWETLLRMQPKPTTLSCMLSRRARNFVHVSGIDSADPDHPRCAIEFVEWQQWLSMPVIVDPELGEMSSVEQLAHVLYEMTWTGYDPAAQESRLKALEDRIEEVQQELDEETKQ